MAIRRATVVTAMVLLLAGCEATTPTRESLPTALVLQQNIQIPPERAAVFIQGGRVQSFGELNAYAPHCKLELRQPLALARTITPDRFAIIDWSRQINVTSRAQPLRKASYWLASGGDQPSYWVYATVMELSSAQQPAVFRLTCQHWELGDASFPRHVRIEEMQATLAGIATLE